MPAGRLLSIRSFLQSVHDREQFHALFQTIVEHIQLITLGHLSRLWRVTVLEIFQRVQRSNFIQQLRFV